MSNLLGPFAIRSASLPIHVHAPKRILIKRLKLYVGRSLLKHDNAHVITTYLMRALNVIKLSKSCLAAL